MTDDPEAEFLASVPPHLRSWREADDLPGWISLAAQNGWPIKQFARECSAGLHRTFNAHTVIRSRLHRLAQQRPPHPRLDAFVQPLPWCGECDSPTTRRREDPETGLIIGHCDCWTDPS